jgi:fatty aldehyde-generating acyl-ACP reductase
MPNNRAEKTAFIVHPPDADLFRSYIRFLRPDKSYNNEFLIKLFEWTPTYKVGEFSNLGFNGNSGIDASFIMVPFLPEMRDISLKQVIEKIDNALEIASSAGCTVAAMGGFTSIVLQGQERDFAEKHGIRITSGNSLTAAIILKSIEIIAAKFGIDLTETSIAIIGASGDIGSACMGYLCTRAKKLYVTGRSAPALQEAVDRHRAYMSSEIVITNNNEAIENSRICIFVTSAYDYLFHVKDFKPGTIVCDASSPLNVKVDGLLRDDVFLYHGGVASIPFPIDAGFDIGLPSMFTFYGCQLEGLLLGLHPELPCSWGRGNITRDKLELFMKKLDEYEAMDVVFSNGDISYSDEQLDAYARRWRSGYPG